MLAFTKIPNLPKQATLHDIFSAGLLSGKRILNNYTILVLSLPVYLTAFIYYVRHFKYSNLGLASIALQQIRNLTQYLFLELPHQQFPLLKELEEYEFMDDYPQN